MRLLKRPAPGARSCSPHLSDEGEIIRTGEKGMAQAGRTRVLRDPGNKTSDFFLIWDQRPVQENLVLPLDHS